MISCSVPLIESFTTGAMMLFDSKVNFIGNVSFEGNQAVYGGKEKFEDALPPIRRACTKAATL